MTRSGTNAFHGSLFEYFRDDELDAKDWFVNANRLPKPEERLNDFGGAEGGQQWPGGLHHREVAGGLRNWR